MHQVSATIWNQIAESQPLKTDWAKQMFPLPEADLETALDREHARISANAGEVVAAAYLKIMPLLWERTAILNYLKDNPSLTHALPEVTSVSEAVDLASRDFRLSNPERARLTTLLQGEPH